jgi:hypothetical protein
MYLGDGWVGPTARSANLVVTLDNDYPEIIEEAWAAMVLASCGRHVAVRRHPHHDYSIVSSYARHWLDAFPQYGRGKKHNRRITLADWQRQIVDEFPEQFLRGLIHSDGCRVINRFKTKLPSGKVAEYAYPRYFFSNLSADIRGLFCEYCERLGVRWTQSNHRNISVSHRKSVAILDGFIGPKA